MAHIEDEKYGYGFSLGQADGRTARAWLSEGKPVDHGDLLSRTDPYAEGYRDGFTQYTVVYKDHDAPKSFEEGPFSSLLSANKWALKKRENGASIYWIMKNGKPV